MNNLNPCYLLLRSGLLLAVFGLLAVNATRAHAQSTTLTNVEPYVVPYVFGSSTTVSYPDSVEFWENHANLGDFGAPLNSGITWDETTGISVVNSTLIFPTNTTPLEFHTNYIGQTYQRQPDGINWTVTGQFLDFQTLSFINVTNMPCDPPLWYIQATHKQQTSHTSTANYQLADESIVSVVTTTTNDTRIRLYSGISATTTNAHLFRLNVHVWDTRNDALLPYEQPEYPTENIRIAGLEPDANGDVFLTLADDQWVDVTPTLAGVIIAFAPLIGTDIQYRVTPERTETAFNARYGKMAEGYDPRPGTREEHWTSVAVGGVNLITQLELSTELIKNKVWLSVSGPILVQTNGVVFGPTDDLTEATTPLEIVSTGSAGNAKIEVRARSNGTVLRTLNVIVLPMRQVPVGIYSSPNFQHGISRGVLIQTLNEVFKQACLEFIDVTDIDIGDNLDVYYDVNANDRLDSTDAEVNLVWNRFQNLPRQLPVALLPKTAIAYPIADLPEEIKYVRGATFRNNSITVPPPEPPLFCAVFGEGTGGIIDAVLAHEVGHFFGLEHRNVQPESVVGLMIAGLPYLIAPPATDVANWYVPPQPGRWLWKEAWEIVNSRAALVP